MNPIPLMLGFVVTGLLAAGTVYAFNYRQTGFALGSAVMGLITFVMVGGLGMLVVGVLLLFSLPS